MDISMEKACSIEDSIDLSEEYQSVVDRYYTRKYCISVCEPGDDYSVLIHSNGVCLLSLAPSHPFIKGGVAITSVSFQVSNQVNRLDNKVSGKWKHGAQKVKPTSPILVAQLEDGSSKPVHCSITGKLLEVNQRLVDEPSLMVTSPQDVGYIAIILPDLETSHTYRNHLLSLKDYENAISRPHPLLNSELHKLV